ncbi:MAG: peptide chain release factor N(5)-glutamine methyltransferase, partial [Novosphingobium sp.]|nr:peptide chain release factor N(5)-glutamine methyltransferase [Novosphingobium sp.]
RRRHEPVAHIIGQQEFYGLPFRVTPDVLIPRGDSEVLVEAALAACPDARRVLDCGTGSGALLLAVLANLPKATGAGIDRSDAALAIAAINATALDLQDRARMVAANWDEPGWTAKIDPPYDLVLANPPYVETEADLAPSVRDYEPGGALFAGLQGLDAYRSLIPQLPNILSKNGMAFLEIGATQADPVSAIAGDSGFAVRVHRDLANRPRVLELSGNT